VNNELETGSTTIEMSSVRESIRVNKLKRVATAEPELVPVSRINSMWTQGNFDLEQFLFLSFFPLENL